MKEIYIKENMKFFIFNKESLYLSQNEKLFLIKDLKVENIIYGSIKSISYTLYKINENFIILNEHNPEKQLIIDNVSGKFIETNGVIYSIINNLPNFIILYNENSIALTYREFPFKILWEKNLFKVYSFFCDNKFLFFHNFENKFQINCISLADGSDLWSRDFTGTYWYDDSVHGRTNSILLSTYNTVSEGVCLLSISNHGIVALEAATGKLMWEDTKQRFFGIEKFKVFKDKFYQFVCNKDEFNEFYIRVGDIFTGKELQFKRIKDIVPDIDRQKNCVFAGKNERFTITEKYVIFDDAEFLFILDRDSLELIDSIKIPFKKGVYYGPRQAPQYQDGYIFHLTYGSKIGSNNLYVFKIED